MSKLSVTIEGIPFDIQVEHTGIGQEVSVVVNGAAVGVTLPSMDHLGQVEKFLVEGRPYEVLIDPQFHWIASAQGVHHLDVRPFDACTARSLPLDGRVISPIPGAITSILVAPGEIVEAGQPLLILEAMKMENQITAPRSGIVSGIHIDVGHIVSSRVVLMEIVDLTS